MGGSSKVESGILSVSYLNYDDDDLPTKVFVIVSFNDQDTTSGSASYNASGQVQPTFKLKGKAVGFADLTVPISVFDTTIVAAPAAAIVLEKGATHWAGYLTKAS